MSKWIVCLIAASLVGSASAEEAKKSWSDTAELSYVVTGGNSDTNTLGFKNEFKQQWENAAFTLKAGAVRAESTDSKPRATGSPGDFEVTEVKTTTTTADLAYLNGTYERTITERTSWYVGAGWDRNTPAGVLNRYSVGGGIANVWHNTDDLKFKTFYGLTYTKEENEVELVDDTFAGLRAGYGYLNKLTGSTTLFSDLILDVNLDETDDFRADWTNAVAVAMSTHLALKATLQLLYDHEPALEIISLNGGPATVTIPRDDLDTIFTTSLVVNF
jgi:putative salt-induced outer membrane protein YdiY